MAIDPLNWFKATIQATDGNPKEVYLPSRPTAEGAQQTDTTLGVSGMPADAAAVGTEIDQIKKDLTRLDETKVGYSEVVNGQLLMYSDDTKGHLLATLDLPGGGVSDVQVAGTSVVRDGVANIPSLLTSNLGVCGYSPYRGMALYGGTGADIGAKTATPALITKRAIAGQSADFALIGTDSYDFAVKAALTDGKGAAWTAEEQAAGRGMMGLGDYILLNDITVTEDTIEIVRTSSDDGNPYNCTCFLVICHTIPADRPSSNIYVAVDREGRYGSAVNTGIAKNEERFSYSKTELERGIINTESSTASRHYAFYGAALGNKYSSLVLPNMFFEAPPRAFSYIKISIGSGSRIVSGDRFRIYGVKA